MKEGDMRRERKVYSSYFGFELVKGFIKETLEIRECRKGGEEMKVKKGKY